MTKLTLKDLSLKGKRVLMRVDFNVPIKEGMVADDSKIVASLPSINYVLQQGASLILMSHLGRPASKPEPQFSLAPVAKKLSELIKKPVQMAPDCVGPKVEKMASALKIGSILMLENLRFHPGEEEPEKYPDFVKQLANLGDVFVNDAFGTAHRLHASTAAIAQYFPNKAAAGFLMESELSYLSPLIHSPKRPFYAIMGGAKISTKIGVIQNLLKLIDGLFLGGAMVYTFLKCQGIKVGNSLVEDSAIAAAKEMLKSNKLHFPKDLVIAEGFSNDAKSKIISYKEEIPDGWQGMDIGPETAEEWGKILKNGATIFWNGPLGVFEMPQFAQGTKAIAKILADTKANTVVGGGDSIAAIQQLGLADSFSHLSTGGGRFIGIS